MDEDDEYERFPLQLYHFACLSKNALDLQKWEACRTFVTKLFLKQAQEEEADLAI